MNLNDFVVPPNNKAKSVRLNARNLQELHVETVTIAQESKEIEEKLRQLKESMSKEKEERGHGFRWKFGQSGSLNSNILKSMPKKNKENRLQKLSAGKVKIRVLKDEPFLTGSPQPPPPPPAPTIALPMTRKNRLRGTICGQCEVKTAGIMCAECTENYCVGCFAKFHQKGALKLHRMIPIQTDLRNHVSTQDVISSFEKQMNPVQQQYYPNASTVVNPSPDSQLNYNHTFMSSARTRQGDLTPEKGTEAVAKPMQFYPHTSQLFVVNHGEEKVVEMTEEHPKSEDENGFSTSLLSGEYNEEESARSFQEAVRQWRRVKNDGAEEPVNEEAMWIPFQPVSVSAIATQADLPPDRSAEGRGNGGGEGRIPVMVKFTENNLTYMDRLLLKKHRRTPLGTYNTSMALDRDLKSLPNTSTEEDTAGSLTAREEDFRRYCSSLFAVPVSRGRIEPLITTPESCLVIHVLDEIPTTLPSKGRTLVPQTTFCLQAVQPKAAQKLHPSKPQTSRTEQSLKSKSKPSACSTAETPRTSKTSVMAPTSKSQKSNVSPITHKSKDDHGSPQLLSSLSLPHSKNDILKFPHSPPTCSPTISLVRNGSDSSLLPEPHSPQLFPENISSPKLSQSPLSNVESSEQSQHLLCVPELLPIGNELEHHLSLYFSKPNPQPKSPEPSPCVKTISSLFLFTESPPDVYSRYNSTPEYMDAPVFMSSTPISGDQESTLSHQDTNHNVSLPLHPMQNPPAAEKMEMEEIGVLSIDSADEMSSDSLGLAQNEEDTSDEEAQIYRPLTRRRSSGEEQENLAISHLEHCFVKADEEQEKNLQTEEPEQLVEPSMMMYNQCARPDSELDEFTPRDLDLNSGHSNKPEHTLCDQQHTCQTLLHKPDPAGLTGSKAHGPHSSLSAYSEEHLVSRLMRDSYTQPTGIRSHSTTHTRRGEISANALETSACLSYPMLGSDLGPAFRPLSRAAREIMEICNVDQTGCEDPDLDTDTTAHTLHGLEQELRFMSKETGTQPSVTEIVNSGRQDRHGNLHVTKGSVNEEAKEEEEAKQRDLESVLLLP